MGTLRHLHLFCGHSTGRIALRSTTMLYVLCVKPIRYRTTLMHASRLFLVVDRPQVHFGRTNRKIIYPVIHSIYDIIQYKLVILERAKTTVFGSAAKTSQNLPIPKIDRYEGITLKCYN